MAVGQWAAATGRSHPSSPRPTPGSPSATVRRRGSVHPPHPATSSSRVLHLAPAHAHAAAHAAQWPPAPHHIDACSASASSTHIRRLPTSTRISGASHGSILSCTHSLLARSSRSLPTSRSPCGDAAVLLIRCGRSCSAFFPPPPPPPPDDAAPVWGAHEMGNGMLKQDDWRIFQHKVSHRRLARSHCTVPQHCCLLHGSLTPSQLLSHCAKVSYKQFLRDVHLANAIWYSPHTALADGARLSPASSLVALC